MHVVSTPKRRAFGAVLIATGLLWGSSQNATSYRCFDLDSSTLTELKHDSVPFTPICPTVENRKTLAALCEIKRPHVCDAAGRIFEQPLGYLKSAKPTPDSLQRAAGFYEKACRGGFAESCVAKGKLVGGNGALGDFARGCELGNGEGCARAAEMAPKDAASWIRKALAADEPECINGNGEACTRVAELSSRIDPNLSTETVFALKMRAGCLSDRPEECLLAAVIWHDGFGVHANSGFAKERLLPHADVFSAILPPWVAEYTHQPAVLQDGQWANAIAAACQRNVAFACEAMHDLTMAGLYGHPAMLDESSSNIILKKACGGGLGRACDKLHGIDNKWPESSAPQEID